MRTQHLFSVFVSFTALAAAAPRSHGLLIERAYDPKANKGLCDCPLAGPPGTCLIKPLDGTESSAEGSATCEGIGFYYTCGGSYDQPNCNICVQAYPNNAAPHREMWDCPGMKWCSADNGKTFHICALHEEPFHPAIHVEVEIGKESFDIGDYDLTQISSVISDTCDPNGCHSSPTTEIDFGTSDSKSMMLNSTATLTVEGSANADQSMVDNLIKVVSATLQASKQCVDVNAIPCIEERALHARLPPDGLPRNCPKVHTQKCSVVDYVRATAYDIDSNKKAHLTFNGKSADADKFPCDNLLDSLSTVATLLDFPPVVQGSLAIGGLVCGAFKD